MSLFGNPWVQLTAGALNAKVNFLTENLLLSSTHLISLSLQFCCGIKRNVFLSHLNKNVKKFQTSLKKASKNPFTSQGLSLKKEKQNES
jgi:hypothetical protein